MIQLSQRPGEEMEDDERPSFFNCGRRSIRDRRWRARREEENLRGEEDAVAQRMGERSRGEE